MSIQQRQQHHTSVDQLNLSVHQMTAEGDYESLLEWIRTTTSLEQITLDGHGDYTLPAVSPAVVARFLRAIQTIQKVELVGCLHVDATVFSNFISTTTAVDLEMDCAVFSSDEANATTTTMAGKEQVASAFRHNRTLKRLYLEITEETQPFVVEIIRQLAFNDTLEHLVLEWSPPEKQNVNLATTQALEALLLQSTSSSSLEHLELQYFEFLASDSTLEPLARGLRGSRIQKLSLQLCRLDDSATHLLEHAIKADTNRIRTLALPQSQFGTNNNEGTLTMLTNIINSPTSSLTSLQLDSPRLPDKSIPEFVQAVQNCQRLQRLSLDYLKNDRLYNELIRCLPYMRYLKELRLHLADVLVQSTSREQHRTNALAAALRRNGSLTCIEILPHNVLPNNHNSRSSTMWLTQRNRGVQAWWSSSTTQRRLKPDERAKRSPKFFHTVAETQYGDSVIFRELVELNNAVGPRQQPQAWSGGDDDDKKKAFRDAAMSGKER